MQKSRVGVCAIIFAVVLYAMHVAYAQSPDSPKKPKNNAGTKAAVQEITLPEYAPDIPPGPNQKIYEQHCLLCHSSRYVLMQPPFSRTVWEKEVKKMVDAYGAPITAADQPLIVDYLVAIRGPAEKK
jgi:cytochrome c5